MREAPHGSRSGQFCYRSSGLLPLRFVPLLVVIPYSLAAMYPSSGASGEVWTLVGDSATAADPKQLEKMFANIWLFLKHSVTLQPLCACGGIGRRARLRI